MSSPLTNIICVELSKLYLHSNKITSQLSNCSNFYFSGGGDFGFSDGRGAPSGGQSGGGATSGGGLSLGEQFLNLVNDTIGPEDLMPGAPAPQVAFKLEYFLWGKILSSRLTRYLQTLF